MCIRDRVYAKDLRGGAALTIAGLGAEGMTAVENTEYIDSCLLYTSDAADERSSVDLGGRRIIKKKTTMKTSRRV